MIMWNRKNMKKKIILLICVIFIGAIIIVFCRMKYDISNTYIVNEKEDYNYEVIIKQYNGKVIISEEYNHTWPTVQEIGKDMIALRVSGGLSCLVTRFINVKNGNISEKFVNVMAYNSDKVVYPAYKDGDMKIIVQDIFDPNKYYYEIIRDYAPDAIGTSMVISTEFLSDTSLYLEYYKGEEWEEMKEIIDL